MHHAYFIFLYVILSLQKFSISHPDERRIFSLPFHCALLSMDNHITTDKQPSNKEEQEDHINTVNTRPLSYHEKLTRIIATHPLSKIETAYNLYLKNHGSLKVIAENRTAPDKKRYHIKITNTEKDILISAFFKNSRINKKQKETLAKQTNLTQAQVRIWFQNFRMKIKQQKKTYQPLKKHRPSKEITQDITRRHPTATAYKYEKRLMNQCIYSPEKEPIAPFFFGDIQPPDTKQQFFYMSKTLPILGDDILQYIAPFTIHPID